MSNNNPLVSVIVPVYKSEQYLKQGIATIQKQTYQNIEIILVDDGSPNNAGKLADEIATTDSRIKVFHKENGGTASALNKGIEMAQGEFVTISGDDDLMHPQCVELLLKLCLENQADVGIGCIKEIHSRDEAPELISDSTTTYERKEAVNALIDDEVIRSFFQAKLIRSELVKQHPFPEGMSYEDVAIFQDILLDAEKIVYTPSILFYYYQNPESILHTRTLKLNLDQLKAYDMQARSIVANYPEFQDRLEMRQFRFEISTLCYYLAEFKKDKAYEQAMKDVRASMKARFKNLRKQGAKMTAGDYIRYVKCNCW